MQILKDYSKSIISYRVILSLFCNLVFVSFILSQNINYISIEHSLSSYFKLTPSIAHPFDHKDFFYANLDNSYSDNALSINHTYRRNKKIKSVKKLKQFKSKIEGGENENTYVIYNTHHGNNVSIPVVVDLNWYFPNALAHNQRFELEKKITKNFTSRSNRRNIPDAALRLINQDIAGTNVALNIRGDISVNGEIIFENKDLIALNSNENKSFDIDIEQTQRFDLEGKIGEKLTLNATQDSEADFNWENDLTIKWEGDKNDILQLAEAGNISLSLPSTQFVSVGSGKSEGLFGLKTVHQFGPLEIQSIMSREQVKKAAKSFSGGQTSEWSYINDYNFIKDRYFFIEQKFKSQYYPLKINNGNLVHSYNPNGIVYDYEIYKKSITSNDDGVLDIVYGTAFIDPQDSSSTQISGNWKKLIEGQDYEIDRLLGYIRLNTISSQEAVAICYDYGNYDYNTGTFTKDSTLNNGTDLVLVYDICKDPDYDGTNENCDADGDGIVNEEGDDYDEFNDNIGFQPQEPKPITMRLVKLDSPTTPNYDTWPLMFKNVYSLGSSISDLNSLELDVIYNNAGLEETHSQVNNFQSFLTIFGLDTRNANGDELIDPSNEFYLGDGKIDNNTVLINPIYGELFLPSHLPFAYDNTSRSDYEIACDIGAEFPIYITPQECQELGGIILDEIFNYSDFTNSNVYWGINSSDLEYYLDTELEDQDNNFSSDDSGPAMYYSVDNQEIISEHEFMIKYKHSSGNSTIDLGGFMIVEGSETVTLNGTILTRGVDYTIDYFTGTINFINADAMLPGANINITYEENELISVDQKLLFGTHMKYGFDSQNFISGGLFFYDQSIMDKNVEIGYEPMQNFIWNINGRYEREIEKLTEVINDLPFIEASAPSKISFEGEFAEVYPDPNPLGQGFLDDFEASKRSVSLNLSARNWKTSSAPFDSLGAIKSLDFKKDMIWYNPYNEIQTTDIWPNQETSSQAGNAYTKTLWLRPLFNELENESELWNGITTSLYSSDYDLSRKKYLEIWVNADNFDEDEILLHIDLGHVSEDVNQDNYLNTEDLDVYGNGWGDNNLSDEEDVGLDLCPDLYENGSGGCNCKFREDTYSIITDDCGPDYENPDSDFDPNGDNWCYNTSECSDINYYRQYNGTEGNADLGRYPDTEDLDKDYNLDVRDDYFTTTIDPASDGYDEYIASTNWKLFRILLNDFQLRGDSTATWNDIRHIRLWVDGVSQSDFEDEDNPRAIKIAKLEIVGNEWLELGSTPINQIPSVEDDEFNEEPYFAVSVLNTHDNPNEYEPPNESVQGEVDQVSGIRMKEQSLVLSFEDSNNNDGGIESSQAVAIKKSFSALPMDKKNSFFAYKNLNMYVYGEQDTISGGLWQNSDSNVELLFRFGKDDQYYEVRQPVYKKWDEKNHIDINIDQLTKYKLEISLEEYDDTGLDGCYSNIEDGFGSCLDTLSFSHICESEQDLGLNINQDRCNQYLLLPENSPLRTSFDPNEDGPINTIISEPTDNIHPNIDNITELNGEYDCIEPNCDISLDTYNGEPFVDLNENYLFDPPPSFYDATHDVWVWDENIQNVCNYCEELRIKGTPSINNIEFIMVSVLNNTDQTVFGNVWLDELRMTGVKKEKGQAFRLKGSIAFSDLLNINSSYEQKDADFHLLQERLGTGDNQRSVALSAKLSSGKFLPKKWGIKIPINFNYTYDMAAPKFYPGSDILSGGIDDAPQEIKTINKKTSISTSFDKNTKSDNMFVKYTIDKVKFNFSFIDRYKSTPTVESETAKDISVSTSYDYNFSDSNFLQPFNFLKSLPIIGKQIAETRLYWSPESFSTSVSLSEHNQISTQRTGSITPTYSLNLDRKYKMNYRITKNLKFTYQKDMNSNFDDIFLPDGESLNSNIPEVVSSFFSDTEDRFGLVKNKSEGFNINFVPDFMKWLNPNLKYSSSYSWALSNDQNSANVGSVGSLLSSVGFSLTDLVELYYKPEKSKSKNRRRGRNSDPEPDNEPAEITNPIVKSIFQWAHTFSEKFSKINVNHTYKVSNTHGNILVNEEPSFYYRFALSTNPHDGSTAYNDSSGSVNSFYNQYTNDFKISTNVSLTKKIQASIDYRDNRVLTLQSTSDPTENISNTYFPLGIRGDEGFPIFNWNINWSGVERLFFLDKIFRTISFQHTFNGDYNASYKDEELLTWGYSRNFSPFFGITAKTNHKNPYTFRLNYIRTLYITNSGTSTEQKHTNQLNGRIDFNRTGGLRIPIFFFRDFNIENDINFGVDIIYDNSETLMTSVIIDDDSDFNQQDLSKTWSIKPRISYSFTNYITGDFYFNYIYTENKTTGSTEERDLGFNVRIKIKG